VGDRGTGGSADVMGESAEPNEAWSVTCAPHSVSGPWPSWTPPVTDFFSQSFVRLVAKSGLPAIRLHDLRHTHATFLKTSDVALDASFDTLCDRCPIRLLGSEPLDAAS
jgi:hypothetical protein